MTPWDPNNPLPPNFWTVANGNIGVDDGRTFPNATGPKVSMPMTQGQSQGSLFSQLYGRAPSAEELSWHNANPTALNPNWGAASTGQPASPASGPASRSPQGSYWQLPDGRFFVPQNEISENGGGGWDDYASVNSDLSGGFKAYGTGGTPHTFDNTGGVLPGYGRQPWAPSSGFGGLLASIKQGQGQQEWGPTQGTVYNSAPEERAFKTAPEETFMQALTGGDNSPGMWAPSPLAMFAGAAGGIAAGMGAFGGAGAGAGVGESVSGAYGATAGELSGYAGSYGGAGAGLDSGAGLTGSGASGGDIFNPSGGSGMDFTDFGSWNDFVPEVGNTPTTQMPPAVPETTQTLTDWGMKEIGQGRWAMPGEVAGTLYEPLVQKFGEQAAKSLLGKLMSGEASAEDYMSILGKLGATGLGLLGSNNQSNALSDLAKKYQEYGAPSRGRYEASMTPGFDPNSIPGYAGALDSSMQAMMRKLSTQGNPFGNPGGLIEANKAIVSGTAMPAIGEYQRLNANTGFGSSMNAALGLQTQGIGADANMYNALGSGLSSITNPPTTLEQALNALNGMQGLKLNSGSSL